MVVVRLHIRIGVVERVQGQVAGNREPEAAVVELVDDLDGDFVGTGIPEEPDLEAVLVAVGKFSVGWRATSGFLSGGWPATSFSDHASQSVPIAPGTTPLLPLMFPASLQASCAVKGGHLGAAFMCLGGGQGGALAHHPLRLPLLTRSFLRRRCGFRRRAECCPELSA